MLALIPPALVLLWDLAVPPVTLPAAAAPPQFSATGELLPLTCPTTRTWMKPGSTAAAPLAPQDPVSAVFCVYAGMNNKEVAYRSLIAQVPVSDPSALAAALSASTEEQWPGGAVSCPMSDGRGDVALFTDQDGFVWSVGISTSGCGAVWSAHTKSYYPPSPGTWDQVRQLEGSLRSAL